jgi:hypothetical protein
MVEVGVRWWPLKADGTRPGAPPAVCRGAEILSALVCPRPPPATLPTYSQPPTRPEPPSPILPTLPCATSAAPQTRNTQQCTPPPQSDEFYRLLDRLRAYTAQNHRDHWAQCTTCGKWRIVDFQAAQRIDDNTEWHCAMLRCERACRDWCKKGGGGGGGSHAAAAGANAGSGTTFSDACLLLPGAHLSAAVCRAGRPSPAAKRRCPRTSRLGATTLRGA